MVHNVDLKIDSDILNLYFDGSKYQEGDVEGCFIIPVGKCSSITRRLEFNCTNNMVEYEALVHGIKKAAYI